MLDAPLVLVPFASPRPYMPRLVTVSTPERAKGAMDCGKLMLSDARIDA
jgi:hypothetical protein